MLYHPSSIRVIVVPLPGASVPEAFKYRAFLSYSRADAGVATRVRSRLEKFRIDGDLVGFSDEPSQDVASFPELVAEVGRYPWRRGGAFWFSRCLGGYLLS